MVISKKKIFIIVLLLVILVVIVFSKMFKIAPVAWNPWGGVNTVSGIAIKGYDAVAFHKLGQATKGDSSFTTNWNNAKWQFISNENRALFEADPESYAPQFGGYCATAVSLGMTADTNPESWHIENGKLYLFFNDDPKNDYIAQIDGGIIGRSEQRWGKR